ncbi:PilZ domain-containing protein [Acidithiobacillus sp. CV18-2]|nr:PilZ domain-containing protein [Acidithiobacillus sp. CV18-3]MBU2756944.1 PilZ domain-containing protein [Acidithiobacillus sp. BN09-2]MBU2777555.1 PilZ domain-containing protein [Acidithiobacillus sp. CV18-2]MBU2799655.1 PilZ domain-containing protein [Acidithiobacillus sp. VAN18-4]
MSLTDETDNLTMFLPIRGELGLLDYFAMLRADESIVESRFAICGDIEEWRHVILFSENEQDNGCRFHLCDVESGRVLLKPKCFVHVGEYNQAMIVAEKRDSIFFFLAHLEYVAGGIFHYHPAKEVFHRKIRSHKRIQMRQSIVVRKRDARTFTCDMVDFSPVGIGFTSGGNDFDVGEMLLLEIRIPDCGVCETTITISHRKKYGMSNAIYGARLRLTKEQAKKATFLYLCARGEHIRSVSEASRLHDSRWRD